MFRGKRVFDVIGAIGGLLFFAPVMIAAAAAIALDDGRPLFFRQIRLGRWRRPFSILKFRTMRDGRVTRVGALLRATGLDELPQFVNILRGELSAVGPRPITEEDAERFGYTGPSARTRWSVAPGLTGIAQLCASSCREALVLDRCYVRRPGVRLDCRIVAMSFVVNILGKSRARRLLFGRTSRQRRPSPVTARIL
jgi:lipopolysaccharide/colanic/teichoic acid biosynthesis glycosyltransferase